MVEAELDITIALVALAMLLPVMVVIAAAIAITDRGSPIFSHNRLGYRGQSFRCLKFRTMHVDAEARLRTTRAARGAWRTGNKLPEGKDPRITRLGHMLRRTSLDELPQLWNVLRGDMSIVGPRPITGEELERYGAFAADYGLAARPERALAGHRPQQHRFPDQGVPRQSVRAELVVLQRSLDPRPDPGRGAAHRRGLLACGPGPDRPLCERR